MIRSHGRYANKRVELDQPLDLPEGTKVELDIRPAGETDTDREGWFLLSASRLQEEWDNPEDAIYDDWKKLYGVEGG
jgi:hypothetical protein